jgi:hypothetical protein
VPSADRVRQYQYCCSPQPLPKPSEHGGAGHATTAKDLGDGTIIDVNGVIGGSRYLWAGVLMGGGDGRTTTDDNAARLFDHLRAMEFVIS